MRRRDAVGWFITVPSSSWFEYMVSPNQGAAANGDIASLLQSPRPVAAVAELVSLDVCALGSLKPSVCDHMPR